MPMPLQQSPFRFLAFGRTHPMIGQTVPGTLAVTHCCLTCYALTRYGTQVALPQHAGCHTSLRSRVGWTRSDLPRFNGVGVRLGIDVAADV